MAITTPSVWCTPLHPPRVVYILRVLYASSGCVVCILRVLYACNSLHPEGVLYAYNSLYLRALYAPSGCAVRCCILLLKGVGYSPKWMSRQSMWHDLGPPLAGGMLRPLCACLRSLSMLCAPFAERLSSPGRHAFSAVAALLKFEFLAMGGRGCALCALPCGGAGARHATPPTPLSYETPNTQAPDGCTKGCRHASRTRANKMHACCFHTYTCADKDAFVNTQARPPMGPVQPLQWLKGRPTHSDRGSARCWSWMAWGRPSLYLRRTRSSTHCS